MLIYGEGYYFAHLTEIFKVWEGGMSFIGGIFGVVVSIFLLCLMKKVSKKEFFVLFDLMLIFVLNQELYGIPLAELPDRLGQFFSSLGL